jgi:uncharacterized protein (DUF433 family)
MGYNDNMLTVSSERHGPGNSVEEATVTTEIKYPHIETPADGPARLKRLPRIRVAQIVMDYLAHGWSPDEMCRQHPNLRLAEVHSAMAYYYDHQDVIDREIESECQEARESVASSAHSPLRLRLRVKGLI